MATVPDSAEMSEKRPRLSRGMWAAILAAAALFGLLVGWLLVQWVRPYEYHGLLIQSPPPLTNIKLTAHTGEPVGLTDMRGKLVVLYFGYTFCPDVCPATMVELKNMMKEMGREADEVQVVMVSVDPERDSPAQLGDYVTQFHPSFIGATGTEEELLAATTQLGIFFEKHEGTPATGYLIDHTATVNVLDENGRLVLVFPFGATGAEMAEDLHHLLN